MRYTALGLVFSSLLVVSGCDSGLDPSVPAPPDDPALSLVLRPFADRQRALLTPVRAADEEGRGRTPRLLQSADLRVSGVQFQNLPADSVDLDTPEDYNYYSDSLGVELGQTYDLTIQLDEGRTITGQATVPGTFQGDAEGLHIFWRASEGAARYRVTVEAAEGNPGGFFEQTLTADTSLVIQPDEAFAPGKHFVTIEALGEHLSAFVRGEASRAGLEGAFGVFGAVTTISGSVTLGSPDSSSASKRSGALGGAWKSEADLQR